MKQALPLPWIFSGVILAWRGMPLGKENQCCRAFLKSSSFACKPLILKFRKTFKIVCSPFQYVQKLVVSMGLKSYKSAMSNDLHCIHTTCENVLAIKNCSMGQGKVWLARHALFRSIKERLLKKRSCTPILSKYNFENQHVQEFLS